MRHSRFVTKGAALALVAAPLGGCASHLIQSAYADGFCAAGDCERGQTSIAGSRGGSTHGATGIVTERECGTRALTRVEVERDLGQGLVTLLTLGIVNPATIRFACAKSDEPLPYISCDRIAGVGGDGVPVQITCLRHATEGDPEPIEFDCASAGTPAEPERLVSFTCEAVPEFAGQGGVADAPASGG